MGSEDAPATAKREDEKNVFSAASICFLVEENEDGVTSLEICCGMLNRRTRGTRIMSDE